jgi:2-polyprenyl-6-methoxyphenol hydroxylase-like FAD-dependent oxidoreductase
MLAQDGHQVTVLEADPATPEQAPVEAWTTWPRRGVAQFHQPHNLFARFRQVCDQEVPGLTERLLAAGCVWVDYLDKLPPSIPDHSRRPLDDTFRFVTGRRPVVEAVIAAHALEQPGVTVRRGVRASGLLTGPSSASGVPHVIGVRTTAGERLFADLVVDAMGRRTPSDAWLLEAGTRAPQIECEDRGFVYYTRYFTGATRPRRIGRALAPIGSMSVLTLDGDNDTWSVTLYGLTGDPALKMLRDPERFDRVVAACPLQAHWLDGTPLTGVLAMAGVMDRYRRFWIDDRPVVTGYAAVGDAWACTNPSAGRGLSVGLVHAQLLRHVVRGHLQDPATFASTWHALTEQRVAPFYWNQVAADRARIAEMTALREGLTPTPAGSVMEQFVAAAARDADVYRGFMETVLCMALPQEVLARPGFREKVERYGNVDVPQVPGPDRRQLLDLLAA